MHCTSTLLLALLAVSLSTTLTTAHKVSHLRVGGGTGGGHGMVGGLFTAHTPTPPTRRKLEEEGCKYWEERAIEQYQTCPAGQIMCHNPNTSQNICRRIEGRVVDTAADEATPPPAPSEHGVTRSNYVF